MAAELGVLLTVGKRRLELLLDGNQINAHVLDPESLLQLWIGGVGDGLEKELRGLLDILKVTVGNSFLELVPSNAWLKVRKLAAINLSRILALQSTMAFLKTIDTSLWRTIRAIKCTMALLLTDTARASEFTGDSLIGAFGLSVTEICQLKIRFQCW
jgi:hypothetical protein